MRAEARVARALAFLENARQVGREIGGNIQLFDPVQALMVRLAGRERAQLLVQSESRADLQAFLKAWRLRLAEERARLCAGPSMSIRWSSNGISTSSDAKAQCAALLERALAKAWPDHAGVSIVLDRPKKRAMATMRATWPFSSPAS